MGSNPNKYYIQKNGKVVEGVLNVKYKEGKYYIKRVNEEGPFATIAAALDRCIEKKYNITAKGARAFTKEALREVTDHVDSALKALKDFG